MLRTVAVLLLLLGLASATPVVCLCAPPLAADAVIAIPHGLEGGAGTAAIQRDGQDPSLSRAAAPTSRAVLIAANQSPTLPTAGSSNDAASLISSSMAAAVASVIATAAGLPSSAPWRLPRLGIVGRLRQTLPSAPAGLAWSPAVPPPR